MRLFCPCSWKVYPWSTEYWVTSLLPPCGRSNHPPVSIGAAESHLMGYWSFFGHCFFSVEILYLSLIFWRVTIVWLDTDIFHFTGLGFIRVFETVQWWLYELWKTVSHYLFKYYSCPSLLSSPLEHQWVPSYLSNLSPSLLSALSLCLLVLHCG